MALSVPLSRPTLRVGGGSAFFVRPLTHFMNNEDDRNYISVGSWMLMMLVTAIPIIGLIMILVWAFTGENESRKNYYRAILLWVLIIIALIVGIVLLGASPAIMKYLHSGVHK